MNVLVTGAGGIVGRQVVNVLWENGYEVQGTDCVFRRDLPIRIQVRNLLDREGVYELLDGIEAVVHLGNHPNQNRGDAQRVFNENVTMNQNLFQAAVERGVKKIVFASSIQAIGAYFPVENRPVSFPSLPLGGSTPARPDNAYGLSKQVGETMLAFYADRYGISTAALRFPFLSSFNVTKRKRNPTWNAPWQSASHAYAWLDIRDAAGLIDVLLRQDFSGARIYMPAAGPLTGESVAEISARDYPDVPWTVPVTEAKSFCDLGEIKEATGWEPAILDPWEE